MTQLGGEVVQLQIADKVRIEVSKRGHRRLPGSAAGQEPATAETSNR